MPLSYSMGSCCYTQLSASNRLSRLVESIYNFVRLSRYIHLSHVNNGVDLIRLRVLLAVNDRRVHLGFTLESTNCNTVHATSKRGGCTRLVEQGEISI